jgi:CheY-like chemotaxis protein
VQVLVLDDHAILRRNLRALLEDEGFLILEAASGEEALQIVRATAVDAVIVDIRLPGMNGNEFIEAAHALRSALHFVIHTGATDYVVPDELRRFGLTEDSVFLKPLSDTNALITRLRSFSAK